VAFLIKCGLKFSTAWFKNKRWSSFEELVDIAFKTYVKLPRFLRVFCYPVKPDQNRAELVRLLGLLSKVEMKNILEIGSGNGGMTFLLSQIASPDARIVTLDNAITPVSSFHIKNLAKKGQRIFSEKLNSQDKSTLSLVSKFFTDQLDVLYIDGAHDFDSVKSDFELYGCMVKDGGLIILHDVHDTKLGVRKFLESANVHFDEIVGDYSLDRYGTAIVKVEESMQIQPSTEAAELVCSHIPSGLTG
jgi:predicted O-methyltransferase YrrM